MKTFLLRRTAARIAVAAVVAMVATVTLHAAPTAATAGAQAETNAVKVKAAGISLQLPNHWTKADLTKESLDQIADNLAAQNPEFAARMHELSEFTAEGTKFYAIDLSNGDAANVMVVPGGSAGLPKDVGTFREDYEIGLADGDTLESVKRVKFAGKTAFRVVASSSLVSPEGDPVPLLIGQLLLRHGDDLVVVTVTTDHNDAGKQTGDAVLDSVQPLTGKTPARQASTQV